MRISYIRSYFLSCDRTWGMILSIRSSYLWVPNLATTAALTFNTMSEEEVLVFP